MPIDTGMDKRHAAYPYDRILLCHRKERGFDMCCHVDKPRKQCAEWKKPVTKGLICVTPCISAGAGLHLSRVGGFPEEEQPEQTPQDQGHLTGRSRWGWAERGAGPGSRRGEQGVFTS